MNAFAGPDSWNPQREQVETIASSTRAELSTRGYPRFDSSEYSMLSDILPLRSSVSDTTADPAKSKFRQIPIHLYSAQTYKFIGFKPYIAQRLFNRWKSHDSRPEFFDLVIWQILDCEQEVHGSWSEVIAAMGLEEPVPADLVHDITLPEGRISPVYPWSEMIYAILEPAWLDMVQLDQRLRKDLTKIDLINRGLHIIQGIDDVHQESTSASQSFPSGSPPGYHLHGPPEQEIPAASSSNPPENDASQGLYSTQPDLRVQSTSLATPNWQTRPSPAQNNSSVLDAVLRRDAFHDQFTRITDLERVVAERRQRGNFRRSADSSTRFGPIPESEHSRGGGSG